MNEWALLVIGLIVGAAAAWLWAQGKIKGTESTVQELRAQITSLQETLTDKGRDIGSLQQQVRAEGEQKVKAQTELTQALVSLQQQRELLEAAEQQLQDTFKALADDALKSNNQAFIDLARTTFDVIQTQAKGDLEARQQAIDGLVQPLKQSLERYEQQVREMEGTRRLAYGGLVEQLRTLQKVTGSLDAALRTSQGRGLWGQLQL
ncbi:MAG: DNA recombination protein RmuC, partial [Acidobacteria bacterium]|nr:DNA recombination protein RmuC [Acidobacteriota bacterium]